MSSLSRYHLSPRPLFFCFFAPFLASKYDLVERGSFTAMVYNIITYRCMDWDARLQKVWDGCLLDSSLGGNLLRYLTLHSIVEWRSPIRKTSCQQKISCRYFWSDWHTFPWNIWVVSKRIGSVLLYKNSLWGGGEMVSVGNPRHSIILKALLASHNVVKHGFSNCCLRNSGTSNFLQQRMGLTRSQELFRI
jgi:hypothetical protein